MGFKIPPETKTFDGESYQAFHTIEVSKKDADKSAEKHRKNGWKVRLVKFKYQPGQEGYVLYGKR